MPLYQYICDACGGKFEEKQSMNDAPLERCPSCGGPARRLITGGSGFMIKGKPAAAVPKCGRDAPCCGMNAPCGRSGECF